MYINNIWIYDSIQNSNKTFEFVKWMFKLCMFFKLKEITKFNVIVNLPKSTQLNNEIKNHVFLLQNMCLYFLQCDFLLSHEVMPGG
jgi:hypothetical protein